MIDSFTGLHRFLSNFYEVPVLLDRVEYPSVEHAYQAAKTLDQGERARIRRAKTSSAAKRLGQQITLRPDWNELRLSIMEDLLRQKFAQPWLKALLLDTGQEELVEGNYWGDEFWGVCRGRGENHLGKLLMKIRGELRRAAPMVIDWRYP